MVLKQTVGSQRLLYEYGVYSMYIYIIGIMFELFILTDR